jgi:hypothetical protein
LVFNVELPEGVTVQDFYGMDLDNLFSFKVKAPIEDLVEMYHEVASYPDFTEVYP